MQEISQTMKPLNGLSWMDAAQIASGLLHNVTAQIFTSLGTSGNRRSE